MSKPTDCLKMTIQFVAKNGEPGSFQVPIVFTQEELRLAGKLGSVDRVPGIAEKVERMVAFAGEVKAIAEAADDPMTAILEAFKQRGLPLTLEQ